MRELGFVDALFLDFAVVGATGALAFQFLNLLYFPAANMTLVFTLGVKERSEKRGRGSLVCSSDCHGNAVVADMSSRNEGRPLVGPAEYVALVHVDLERITARCQWLDVDMEAACTRRVGCESSKDETIAASLESISAH